MNNYQKKSVLKKSVRGKGKDGMGGAGDFFSGLYNNVKKTAKNLYYGSPEEQSMKNQALGQMKARYPGGYSDNAYHNTEIQGIMSNLRKNKPASTTPSVKSPKSVY